MRALRTSLATALVALAGCGASVTLHVQAKSLKNLPLESRLDLLDAENDLFSAIDRRDDAVAAVDDAKQVEHRAEGRVSEEENNLDQAKKRNDQAGIEAGRLAIREAKARRRVKEWDVDLAREQIEVDEALLLVAQARFERARAEIAKKAKAAGAAELKLEDFDKQVAGLDKHAKDVQRDAEKKQKDSEKDRAEWQSLSHQLSDLTGGTLGSAWVQ